MLFTYKTMNFLVLHKYRYSHKTKCGISRGSQGGETRQAKRQAGLFFFAKAAFTKKTINRKWSSRYWLSYERPGHVQQRHLGKHSQGNSQQPGKHWFTVTHRGQDRGHCLKSVFTARETWKKRSIKPNAKTTEQLKHDVVKSAQQQPFSKAARREEGGNHFVNSVLVCFDFSLVCDRLPGNLAYLIQYMAGCW